MASLLDQAYPSTDLGNKANALNELAYIILSGQTGEPLYQEAYHSFKRRFPRWSDVAEASIKDIETAIKLGGLGHQKAAYLRAIARRLKEDFGHVSLSALGELTTEEAEKYLCSLPGVGIKTARCVLLYSLHRPVFPADVHCLRIMSRLGWIRWSGQRAETSADRAQAVIPPTLRCTLHVRFVQHGRTVCRSKPKCSVCVLSVLCPSARKFSEKG